MGGVIPPFVKGDFMATKFNLKVRNPELKRQLEEIVGVVNTLEDANTAVAVYGAPTAPVASTVDLELATQPTAGDTFSISQGLVVEEFTFVETAEDAFDVALGLDVEATQANIVTAINKDSTLVEAGAFASDVSELTALVAGTVGDTIAVESGFTDETDDFSAENLSGGVDGTVGFDGQLRYASDALYVSVGESTTAVSNWKSTVLS